MTKVLSKVKGLRQESRIDEMISRLETQLNLNNFKLREENRIVAEINALKSSRKYVRFVTD